MSPLRERSASLSFASLSSARSFGSFRAGGSPTIKDAHRLLSLRGKLTTSSMEAFRSCLSVLCQLPNTSSWSPS